MKNKNIFKKTKSTVVITLVLITATFFAIQCKNDGATDNAQQVTDNPLDKALKLNMPVLAEFGRGTCVPCKMMKPILEKLEKTYEGRVTILTIDIGEFASLVRTYNITLIPTQIFFDADGKELYRHQGFMPEEEIIEQFRLMGIE